MQSETGSRFPPRAKFRRAGRIHTAGRDRADVGRHWPICLVLDVAANRPSEERLRHTEERADTLTGRLEEAREQAEAFGATARGAQSRAEEASEEARELAFAGVKLSWSASWPAKMPELSREESEQAKREAERLLAETERMRKQREEELNRMKEALSQIAETRRTPMGMV